MRNPFERQEETGRHLKIAVTGPIGSGKTCFGLDAKNHGLGPVAVISLEAGDVLFRDSKRWGGFKPLHTQSIDEMKEAIDFIDKNPGVYGTLVIDTVTGIYEAIVDAKMKDDGSMNRNTWGTTKRAWKSIMLRMVNLPIHIVFVTHEQEITETDATTGNIKVVGQKLDAEKHFGRAPDFLIRLVMKGGKPVGTVMKIRGEDTGFSVGQVIQDPHLGMFAAAVKAGTEARIALPEEVREANDAATTKVAADRLTDELKATELVAACVAGFNAEAHRTNWLAKHKPEIAGLKARHPDLYQTVKAAYDAAHSGSNGTQQEVTP